ncbi:MAG: methylated-DNA--[protein]-cysteine S-methyltransferase [Algoriphagus sp.]|uniref:methylated-DNA--[protein]-cysteine S-methyltransferase n=1 Tax=Algoriphagus sp. TaxID=1872435 RepID=UPI002638D0C0|nr:methylated-DNA--[protein]-cysteine S-methyltransferase [Algoriphagus sp.]MDG1277726.1 methylated-DNA--[protein]-cysteine S-methyltransferase [Algoriphagus sp.]
MPIIPSPLGNILINTQEEMISELRFTEESVSTEILEAVVLKAQEQLQEYFSGKRKTFDLPLAMTGTSFQQRVWTAVNTIPFGQTTSYLKLSQALGNPAAIRAVGAAIGANPVLVIIPCHRIIGTNGQLTGYAGGLDRKEKLLELEGRPQQAKQASLDF